MPDDQYDDAAMRLQNDLRRVAPLMKWRVLSSLDVLDYYENTHDLIDREILHVEMRHEQVRCTQYVSVHAVQSYHGNPDTLIKMIAHTMVDQADRLEGFKR